VGPVTAKHLLAWFAEPRLLFSASLAQLMQVDGVGTTTAHSIHASKGLLKEAASILTLCQKKKVSVLSITDPDYPSRLKEIPDAPTVLYTAGQSKYELPKMVSIVGTRKATAYGRDMTKHIIKSLAEKEVGIVSGLAMGIDTAAHKEALAQGLITYAVMATPPDQVYPAQNRPLAIEVFRNGRIYSEYPPGTKVDARNFPMRNRIIAGLADATIVVEAGESGGALITASLAQDYDRQVFAVPGRMSDDASTGCNKLIASNKAAIFSSVDFFLAEMRWGAANPLPTDKSAAWPESLTDTERQLLKILTTPAGVHIDDASFAASLPLNVLAGVLLKLEFDGLVVSMPGKRFRVAERFMSLNQA